MCRLFLTTFNQALSLFQTILRIKSLAKMFQKFKSLLNYTPTFLRETLFKGNNLNNTKKCMNSTKQLLRKHLNFGNAIEILK